MKAALKKLEEMLETLARCGCRETRCAGCRATFDRAFHVIAVARKAKR